MKKFIASIQLASILLIAISLHNLAQAQSCDSNKPETTPSSRFEINRTEGTASDTETKLTWKICAEGQRYSDGRCTNKATDYTWDDAMKTFGDEGDGWRLPSVDEMSSIVEKQCNYPSLNMSIFTDVPQLQFWTAQNENFSWGVNFGNKPFVTYDKAGFSFVRLVRGKQWFDHLKEQSDQADLEERKKNALNHWKEVLREESKEEFCVLYGTVVRLGFLDTSGYLSPGMDVKLMKTEARRRKLTFNDKQIQNEEVKIGMTECQLYATWGLPDEQNRTVGRWGIHIQHIYGSKYIYTENGRVTSWQD